MGTDFFDEDLLEEGASSAAGEESGDLSVLPLTGARLGRLEKHRGDVDRRLSSAGEEIERLRLRRERLENEQKNLQQLSRKQAEYETGKRETLDRLTRSLALFEKEQARATQMVELFAVLRERFGEARDELQGIDEEQWSEENIAGEIDRAMVLLEDARTVYRKGVARVSASKWPGTENGGEAAAAVPDGAAPTNRGFGYWLKVGAALTLPLAVLLSALLAAYLFLMGMI